MQNTKLLALIRKHESRDDYNIVWGRIKKEDLPPKPLTQMTVGEVLDWQDSIDHKYMSEAAGAYQFMEDTLREIAPKAGVPLTAKFNEKTQDKLAEYLLHRRGWKDYVNNRIGREEFANNLAKEWASFPVVNGPNKGKSFYAGDGLNKAHCSVEEVMEALLDDTKTCK